MINPLSFKTNVFWTLLSQISNIVLQFVIIIVISKYSSIEKVGDYGLMLAIISPAQLFLSMGIDKLWITNANVKLDYHIYNGLALITSLLLPVICCLIFVVFFSDGYLFYSVLVISCYRAVTKYREFWYGIFQQKERMDFIAKSSMIISLGSCILFVSSFIYYKDLVNSFLVVMMYNLLVLFFYDSKRVKGLISSSLLSLSINSNDYKRVVLNGASLGFASFLNSFKTNIPRYIIEIVIGDRSILGAYTAFMQIVTPIGYLNESLVKASIGTLTRLRNVNFQKFKRLVTLLIFSSFVISFLSIIFFVLFDELIITMLFTEDYLNFIYILYFLLIARIILMPTAYFKLILLIFNRINIQLKVMIINTIILVILCFYLTYIFDIEGLLYAIVTSELLTLIMLVYSTVITWRVQLAKKNN